jgi:hypothetical protein
MPAPRREKSKRKGSRAAFHTRPLEPGMGAHRLPAVRDVFLSGKGRATAAQSDGNTPIMSCKPSVLFGRGLRSVCDA